MTLNATVSVPAPIVDRDRTGNIAWLDLTAFDGDFDFGTTVLRTHTAGGVPRRNCRGVGASVPVPYAALYWFYK